MAWGNRSRKPDLPRNWPAIRAAVLRRDGYRCTMQVAGQRCPAALPTHALEVDHIHGRHDHRMSNLRTLCKAHHQHFTQQQAAAARGQQVLGRHPGTPHPSTAYGYEPAPRRR